MKNSPVMKVLIFLSCICVSLAVELTFELPDNAKECFYEEIEAGTDFTVEFQVYLNISLHVYLFASLYYLHFDRW